MADLEFLKKQLRRYRELLANFTRRNKELYYKESKATSINLTKIPFKQSELQPDQKLDFKSFRMKSEPFDTVFGEEELDLHEHFFLNEIKNEKLAKRLDKARLADENHQKEYGISGGWLLGPFLCLRTSAQAPIEDMLIAPILKMPIDFKKTKGQRISLFLENSEISINPSLVLLLKNKFDIKIPEDNPFETIDDVLKFLTDEFQKRDIKISIDQTGRDATPKVPPRFKTIKNEDGEIVERKPIVLSEELSDRDFELYNQVKAREFVILDVFYADQLNASRSVLLHDYDTLLSGDMNHPLLSALFHGQYQQEDADSHAKLRELDQYSEKDNHFVIDIDSTQHRAIDKCLKNLAIVIQGPPGTGKSQTITNLIAENLAKGKKVLFVSEKRPALDVVYNRLKSAEIDNQAILIHSSDLNKTDLYKSFLELADQKPSSRESREWEKVSKDLDTTKSHLNQYADALSQMHTSSGLTVSEIFSECASAKPDSFNLEIFSWGKNLRYEQIIELKIEISELRQLLTVVGNYQAHVWKQRKENTIFSQVLVAELKALAMELAAINNTKESCRVQIETIVLDDKSFKREDLTKFLSYNLDPQAIKTFHFFNNSNSKDSSLDKVIDASVAAIKDNIDSQKTIDSNADLKVVDMLETYYRLPRGFLDWFKSEYWSHKKLRNQVCKQWTGTNKEFVAFKTVRTAKGRLESVYKSLNLDADLNLENLHNLSENAARVKELIKQAQEYLLLKGKLPKSLQMPTINSASEHTQLSTRVSDLNSLIEKFEGERKKFAEQYSTLHNYLKEIPLVIPDKEAFALEHVNKLIESAESIQDLEKVELKIQSIQQNFKLVDFENKYFKLISDKGESAFDLIFGSLVLGWKDEVTAKYPALRSFDHKSWQEIIGRFNDQIRSHRDTARSAVLNNFAERWKNTEKDPIGLGLLKKESSKQRRVLSPREIMEKGAMSTMFQLKPCWLMSPLSISQLLPLAYGIFDVIIFDEASQVRVEDAIPSIVRAKTMVVVGDPKQMPPTNFFAGEAVDDSDDDDDIEIAQSVLDLAVMACPSVMLEWHYRSKSEALIAYSNRAFYGGRLIAPPNPQLITSTDALQFHRLTDAYYEKKNGNKVESEAVIEKLKYLVETNPDKSFGIIAMGTPQAIAIETALDERIQKDDNFRRLLDKVLSLKQNGSEAGLFVKNLENVQGDERDIIIMSVGYAAAEAGKKVRKNFGPLSSKGGGRRLNVAVTRAREKLHIFSSFDPNEIPTEIENFADNPDLVYFGRYLKYAKAISEQRPEEVKRILDSFGIGGFVSNRKPSRFSLDVKRELEAKGHNVTLEIGSCGFYVDLGIHHPHLPTNFLLGIECDGAIWHSPPYARDRDKLRKELLESRGWQIERVGSQEWSKNRQSEIDRLDKAIKAVYESKRVA